MNDTILTEKIGKLGFGYMRLPMKGDDFDMDQIRKMADAFLEGGGTYFDAAHIYEGAEEALRKTVLDRYPGDRDKIQIATKLSMYGEKTSELMVSEYELTVERLGTDRIDFYLLHGLNAANSKKAEEIGAWEYLQGLKAKGAIRHLGFSFHGAPEELDEILIKHPETEFVQIQLNYLDWDDPKASSRRLHETACKHDIPIVVMEPIRGGLLASQDSPIAGLLHGADPGVSLASWALRFSAQQKGVFVSLSGMSTLEQMTDNIATFANLKPLTSKEMSVLEEAVRILNSIPRIECTECRYCVKDCPSQIQIPGIIDLLNENTTHKTLASLTRIYGFVTHGKGKASDCTSCRACEEICPQKLDISGAMAQAATIFE